MDRVRSLQYNSWLTDFQEERTGGNTQGISDLAQGFDARCDLAAFYQADGICRQVTSSGKLFESQPVGFAQITDFAPDIVPGFMVNHS